jgi:preprotein translocase subunit YajC
MNQQYVFLLLLAVAFVVLIVLPGRQRKRQQAQTQAMQDALKPGAHVTTTSGIHGTVSGIGDTTVDVEIAPGVPVTFERRAIMQVVQPTIGGATGTESTPGSTGAGGGTSTSDNPGDDTPGDGPAGTTR